MDVRDLISELSAEEQKLAERIEGYQDFRRLNLLEPSQTSVEHILQFTQRRANLLHNAISALTALLDDGHPGLPKETVTEDVMRDLLANYGGMGVALQEFQKEVAATAAISFGPPVNK